MIFSEWSVSVRNHVRKWIGKRFSNWPQARRTIAANAIWYLVLAAASIFLAFVFTAYFVEPRDLLARLMRLDVTTAGGITGAIVTAVTFLDLALIRQRFCTTACPYGYLQGMLQDKNTLLVIYRDNQPEGKLCIECRKCERVCEMGIDIRKSPHQIECVHCADCIDACEDVMRKIGHPGLIHYSWGEQAPSAVRETWYRRLGFRDAKRLVILLILLFYAIGLGTALSMRRPVLVRIAPDRITLYKTLDDGRYANLIRIKLANRRSEPTSIAFTVEGIPQAELALSPNPLQLAPGESFERTVELRAPRWPGAQDVNRFRILAQPAGERAPDVFEMTFILPPPKETNR
jgi:cytochrome c oxidase accessory protein FixG